MDKIQKEQLKLKRLKRKCYLMNKIIDKTATLDEKKEFIAMPDEE